MLPNLQRVIYDYNGGRQEKTVEERLEELYEKLKEFIGNSLRFSNHCHRRGILENFLVLEIGQYSQFQTIADMIFYPETGYRVVMNRLISSKGTLRMILLDEMGDFIKYESFEIGKYEIENDKSNF